VEAAAAKEFVQNGAIISVDALRGKELACFYRSYNEGVEGLSPASRLFITQIGLEPILRDRARELGAEHHYATEMAGFVQDASGVVATVRPRGGPDTRIRARYMLAADGTHSAVREQLGIGMKGRGSFADCATIYFRADVRELIGARSLSVVYVNQPGLLAFFRFSIKGDAGFLAVFATFDEAGVRLRNQHLSAERCAALVRAALGVPPDFPVAIDDLQPWSASALTAQAFRRENVFLAGDAAHLMPPTGGFGGNTGIADVHNLAWKLAMVLKGGADPALLNSYESERKPLSELIVEQAYLRYVKRVDPSLPATNLPPPADDAAIELGAVYHSAAVVSDDRHAGAGLLEDPRRPSGTPGTRVPHLVLQRGGISLSTHDLADSGFVLLAGRGGRYWKDVAAAEGSSAGIPLKAYWVSTDGDLSDSGERFEDTMGIDAQGAVLLRPDGVIAWRSRERPANPGALLGDVLERLTCRR
jgi:2-polyprenyl-6-methoxyphenol hydroxylase-like FAD-dependent oxidoreductase